MHHLISMLHPKCFYHPKKIKQLIKEYFQVKFKDNEIMQVKLDGGEL